MNLAQIIGLDSRIDPDVAQAIGAGLAMMREEPGLDIPQFTAPNVTLREWSAAKQRHEELYRGPLKFSHLRTLAENRTGMPLE